MPLNHYFFVQQPDNEGLGRGIKRANCRESERMSSRVREQLEIGVSKIRINNFEPNGKKNSFIGRLRGNKNPGNGAGYRTHCVGSSPSGVPGVSGRVGSECRTKKGAGKQVLNAASRVEQKKNQMSLPFV